MMSSSGLQVAKDGHMAEGYVKRELAAVPVFVTHPWLIPSREVAVLMSEPWKLYVLV